MIMINGAVPNESKASFDRVPWRQIADLGNHIRHAYNKIDVEILWSIYESDLGALEHAVSEMKARTPSA